MIRSIHDRLWSRWFRRGPAARLDGRKARSNDRQRLAISNQAVGHDHGQPTALAVRYVEKADEWSGTHVERLNSLVKDPV
jgi:hypothetical protein